jgi:hypothetical protein
VTLTATAELVTTTLERHHLRAFRSADSLAFHHLPNRQGEIVLRKRAESTTSGFEEQVSIFTDSYVGDYSRHEIGQRYTGFHLAYGYNDLMRTLVGRLQVGDTLGLVWRRDNNNDILRDAGLHGDEVMLVITKKTGKKETYLLDSSVYRDNSARAIKIA